MPETTDIWFRTERSLETVADLLGLGGVTCDAENHWEWVIGTLVTDDLQLDVTRTHTLPPGQADTRIFRLDNLPFTDEQIQKISNLLLPITTSEITWGQWRFKRGNDYELIEQGRMP
ncbi:hypothetical protein MalM25_23150 [Planctomycetes bacterium MalM25]|nr:hypothetical protein MalM25_23150 [Planctomycetes bacterium MalM25]